MVYSYNIRHSGTVTCDITSTRQGTAAPEVEIEVVSSSDSYEVDVKASVEFTLKRTYIGPQGYNSDVRNTFTYTVPFPSLTDVDGDGSHKMLGDLKVFTWDNFADLSSLGTVQTSQLGSEENLSGAINLASIDLLELAGSTLRAAHSKRSTSLFMSTLTSILTLASTFKPRPCRSSALQARLLLPAITN